MESFLVKQVDWLVAVFFQPITGALGCRLSPSFGLDRKEIEA